MRPRQNRCVGTSTCCNVASLSTSETTTSNAKKISMCQAAFGLQSFRRFNLQRGPLILQQYRVRREPQCRSLNTANSDITSDTNTDTNMIDPSFVKDYLDKYVEVQDEQNACSPNDNKVCQHIDKAICETDSSSSQSPVYPLCPQSTNEAECAEEDGILTGCSTNPQNKSQKMYCYPEYNMMTRFVGKQITNWQSFLCCRDW